MGNELQQIFSNTMQAAINTLQNAGVENNKISQNEVGNIYDEILNEAPEVKTSVDNLSNQDKEVFEMLSQEKASTAVQSNDAPEGVLEDFGNWFCGLFKKETKDGVIDETKQQATGDCWLLSGVNALSYTEEGREIIKNALDYEDGYTIVRLDGVRPGYCVIIEDDELAENKKTKKYSSGDDDMIIFEMAIEKTFDEIGSGHLVVDPNSPWTLSQARIEGTLEEDQASITGNYVSVSMTLVSGKKSETIKNEDAMRAKLEEFEQNGNKDLAIGTAINPKEGLDEVFEIKDVNGNKHRMASQHAYAIKSVENGVVTVINPWNSGEEIPMDMDDYLELFDYIDVCDLSQNGEDVALAKTNFKSDGNGNRLYEFESNKKGYDKQIQTYTWNKDGGGSKIKDTYINEETNDSLVIEYDKEGNKTQSIETKHLYSEDNEDNGWVEYITDGNGKLISEKTYDKDGNEVENQSTQKDENQLTEIIKDFMKH